MKKVNAHFAAAALLATTALAGVAQADTTPEEFYNMDWPHKGSIAASGVDRAWNKAKREGNQLMQSCLSYTFPLDNPQKNDAAIDDIASSVQALIGAALKKGYTFEQMNAKRDAETLAQQKVEKACNAKLALK